VEPRQSETATAKRSPAMVEIRIEKTVPPGDIGVMISGGGQSMGRQSVWIPIADVPKVIAQIQKVAGINAKAATARLQRVRAQK